MRVAFVTFGCKVNRAESDKLLSGLSGLNAEYVKNAGNAEVVVVNTCAVTEKAQHDCEKYLKRLKNNNPGLFVIVTGCLAELLKERLKNMGADAVVAGADKNSILTVIARLADKSQTDNGTAKPVKVTAASGTGTRAFLKIQDGCDSFCTYCIIPYLRGTPSSTDIDTVYEEMNSLVRAGYKEIVLTGVHIGMYGKDKSENISFTGLLKKLSEIEGDYRIRLSSLEVPEITPELLSLAADSGGRICPHFHISLQSGSKTILSKMGRKYTPGDFISAVEAVRAVLPDACIGADVITGFPGESEALFEETFLLLKQAGLNYLHVFPYSKRPGTPAAEMPEQVSPVVKKSRAVRLRKLGEEFRKKSASAMKGNCVRVLAERGGKGYSDNFYMIRLPAGTPVNTFVTVTVTDSGENYILNGIVE